MRYTAVLARIISMVKMVTTPLMEVPVQMNCMVALTRTIWLAGRSKTHYMDRAVMTAWIWIAKATSPMGG